MMIKHIWELAFADYRYFYLSENCSYHLIKILDVASPKLSLGLVQKWDGGVVPQNWLTSVRVSSQNHQPLELIVKKLVEMSQTPVEVHR